MSISDGLDYTIRKHIENYVPEITETQTIYDGVTITDIPKPFVTVERRPSQFRRVTAGAQASYEEEYYFQIGLYARNPHEVMRLSDKMTDMLRNSMTFYSYNGTTSAFEVVTGVKADVEVSTFTPIPNDDPSRESYNFHGYFDVVVILYRENGEVDFTQ